MIIEILSTAFFSHAALSTGVLNPVVGVVVPFVVETVIPVYAASYVVKTGADLYLKSKESEEKEDK